MKALIKTDDTSNMPISQYIVDTVQEMNTLNKIFGTMVLCLADRKTYVCNGSGAFIAITKQQFQSNNENPIVYTIGFSLTNFSK